MLELTVKESLERCGILYKEDQKGIAMRLLNALGGYSVRELVFGDTANTIVQITDARRNPKGLEAELADYSLAPNNPIRFSDIEIQRVEATFGKEITFSMTLRDAGTHHTLIMRLDDNPKRGTGRYESKYIIDYSLDSEPVESFGSNLIVEKSLLLEALNSGVYLPKAAGFVSANRDAVSSALDQHLMANPLTKALCNAGLQFRACDTSIKLGSKSLYVHAAPRITSTLACMLENRAEISLSLGGDVLWIPGGRFGLYEPKGYLGEKQKIAMLGYFSPDANFAANPVYEALGMQAALNFEKMCTSGRQANDARLRCQKEIAAIGQSFLSYEPKASVSDDTRLVVCVAIRPSSDTFYEKERRYPGMLAYTLKQDLPKISRLLGTI